MLATSTDGKLGRFSQLLQETNHFCGCGQEEVAKIVQCGEHSNNTEDEASHVDEDRRQKRIVKAISVDSVRKLNVFITLLRKWVGSVMSY